MEGMFTADSTGVFCYGLLFFQNIHKELNIPIGIIQIPVGGTTVWAWTSRSLLISDKDFRPIVQHYDSIVNSYGSDGYEKLYNRYVSSLAEYHQLNAEQKKYIDKTGGTYGKKEFP